MFGLKAQAQINGQTDKQGGEDTCIPFYQTPSSQSITKQETVEVNIKAKLQVETAF